MIRKEYFRGSHRAEFAHLTFGEYLNGSILDVGSGGSAAYFKKHLQGKYVAVDFSASRSTPDVYANLEKAALPFHDETFDSVLCFDVLEHVDNPYELFAEAARVARKYVIVALPNNWPAFFWSFIRGHNVTHKAGYGLSPNPRNPGDRHKWFFNLEEGENFIRRRSSLCRLKIAELKYVFERRNDALFFIYPYPLILDIKAETVMKQRPYLLVPFLMAKYSIALPFSWVEEIVKRLIWGWGKYRYLNLFCRQLWVVLQKN